MKTIDLIRRENLKTLIDREGSVRAFAEKFGKSDAQISQWKNASPDSKTGIPRTINHKSARDIEEIFQLPRGWMDQDHIARSDSALQENKRSNFQGIEVDLDDIAQVFKKDAEQLSKQIRELAEEARDTIARIRGKSDTPKWRTGTK